jgi:4-carboxymuconolactone decarboxylase
MSAVAVAEYALAERKIGADQLSATSPAPLALDNDEESRRATNVEQLFGKVTPGLVETRQRFCFLICGCAQHLRPEIES